MDGEYVSKIGIVMDFKCFLGSIHVLGKDKSVVEGGTGKVKKKNETRICRHYTDGKTDEELIGHDEKCPGYGSRYPAAVDEGILYAGMG